jgi:hypothetical protein
MTPPTTDRSSRPRATPLRCEQLEDRSLLCAPAVGAFPAEFLDLDVGGWDGDASLVDPANLECSDDSSWCVRTMMWTGSSSSSAWSGFASSSGWSGSSMFWTSAGSSSAVWSESSGAGNSGSLSGIAYLGGPLVSSSGEPLIAYCGGPVLADGEFGDDLMFYTTMLAPNEDGADGDEGGWVRRGTEIPVDAIPEDDLIFHTTDFGNDPVEATPISAPVAPSAAAALPPDLATADSGTAAANPVTAESPADEKVATDPLAAPEVGGESAALAFGAPAAPAESDPAAGDPLDLGGELPLR